MGYFRENIEKMAAYVPGEQPADGERLIKLNTNENPYPPSPKVLEAVERSARDLRLYPDPTAASLRIAASRAYGVPPEGILAGNGSDELLAMCMHAFVGAGGGAATVYPTYILYKTLADAAAARFQSFDLPEDLSLPPALAGSGARAIFLPSPNSPLGFSVGNGDVEALCGKTDGVVVLDEAYADFAEGSGMEMVGRVPNLIILRSLSKSFSLAGLRVGLAFASPQIAAGLAKVKDSYNLDRISIAAAGAALEDMDYMRANAAKIRATRARLGEGLRALGADVTPSQANFIFARFGPVAKSIYERLKSRGILVRHFEMPRLSDGLRISVGTDGDVARLLEELGEILREEGR